MTIEAEAVNPATADLDTVRYAIRRYARSHDLSEAEVMDFMQPRAKSVAAELLGLSEDGKAVHATWVAALAQILVDSTA